jgi:hypothetical protein
MKARFLVPTMLLAASAPASAAQPLLASQFPARILAAHNAERAALGLPPLVWDNDLGNGAATYVTRMATTGSFEHSDRATRRGIGENEDDELRAEGGERSACGAALRIDRRRGGAGPLISRCAASSAR